MKFDIIDFVNHYVGIITGYIPFEIPAVAIIIPAVAAVLSLVIALWGRKLLNTLKLFVCAGAGYYLGSAIIFPFVKDFVVGYGVEAWMAGAALAVIGALLCKFVYGVAFAGVFAYVTFEFVPDYVKLLNSNIIYAAVAAIVVFAVVLIFRGFVETASTSVGGGAGFSVGLYSAIVAVTAALNSGANGTGTRLEATTPILGSLTYESAFLLAVGTVVALIGFIKQTKNRHMF